MPKLGGLEDLRHVRQEHRRLLGSYRTHVLVCQGTGCMAGGSESICEAFREEVKRHHLEEDVRVGFTGCHGFCEVGPNVVIYPDDILYTRVSLEDVREISEETLVKARPVERLLYRDPKTGEAVAHYHEIPFYAHQKRVVLQNCGYIDPENIEDYIARDGYAALGKVLTEMTPEEVIEEVKRSGLRGRGGAGFPTGLKWEFTRKAGGQPKYLIANSDEGDPGAFMDRSLDEGDPHSILEGMLIAAYATGADKGFIYCRAEYPLAVERLRHAIREAREYGLLGENILGTRFSFDIELKEGAGAFVCGEETALIASIMGQRGTPRPRPPFPATSGLWGKPTNINNVKSYATVPQIILKGPDWFSSMGTRRSKGTMVYALTGQVNNTGLVEIPMGSSLGDVVFDIGGGVRSDREFKAVQIGGPLGGCLPADLLNTPVDYESVTETGAIMGSGGMIVVDERTCMVEFAKFFLTFVVAESCGRCPPCRIGSLRMLEILTDITQGRGRLEDLKTLEDLSKVLRDGSLCALGQAAPNPLLTTMKYFRDEYIEHIVDKKCRAGVCPDLARTRCTNACPAEVDVPSFVALAAQGRFAEALAVHRQRNPFPLICGRICPAFCEDSCRRSELDEPIAIRAIKRFMADHERENPWTPPIYESARAEKVAVVGAGPAGLTAALRLAQKGYAVTVFEKLPVAGGMMAVGIPDYRLPKDILQLEIDNIRRAGVEIHCNRALGRDFTIDGLLGEKGYNAVVLAIGAHTSRELQIEGEDLAGVYHGVDFLRNIALGMPLHVANKRVAIVGGGDVAVDVARSAWRLGAGEVHIIYRRTRQDMPAHREEITAVEAEGTTFNSLTNPVRVLGNNGRMTGVEVQNQILGEFDRSARRRPIPQEDSNFVMEAEVLVPAIGQAIDLSWSDGSGIKSNGNSTLAVNSGLATTRPGVFAAGDAVTGPATVIQAVAHGNQVALQVDHYLRTGEVEKMPVTAGYSIVEQPFDLEDYAYAHRAEMPELSVAERQGNFEEVELGMDETTIREECKRCLRCDLEWLEMQGLSLDPMPERALVEEAAF
jgi:NADH-quinone oxidoreductase subunit F